MYRRSIATKTVLGWEAENVDTARSVGMKSDGRTCSSIAGHAHKTPACGKSVGTASALRGDFILRA
jgi:hypothetical protein